MKCVLSIKESNFNAKIGSKFSHLLYDRGADPHPPPLTVSLTIKRTILMTPLSVVVKRNVNM